MPPVTVTLLPVAVIEVGVSAPVPEFVAVTVSAPELLTAMVVKSPEVKVSGPGTSAACAVPLRGIESLALTPPG